MTGKKNFGTSQNQKNDEQGKILNHHTKMKYLFLVSLLLISFTPLHSQNIKWSVLHADEIHEWINSNSKDTLLIVNVWASWCVPCREEFPLLMRAAKEYRNTPVRFAFISADFKSDTSKAREFLIGQGFTGIAYWKRGDDQEFINNLAPEWSGALPVTIFFLNGKRLFYHEGIINERLLNEKIQSFPGRR